VWTLLTVLSDIWAISHTEPAPALAARPSAIGQAPAGSASSIFRGIISSRSQAHRPRHLGGKQNRSPDGEKLPGGFRRENWVSPAASILTVVIAAAGASALIQRRGFRARFSPCVRMRRGGSPYNALSEGCSLGRADPPQEDEAVTKAPVTASKAGNNAHPAQNAADMSAVQRKRDKGQC
jgi:hypothetical protein